MQIVPWYISDTVACGIVRGDDVARYLNRRSKIRAFCKQALFKSDIVGADTMVFQRTMNPALIPHMETAKSQGVKLVFDIDDNLFELTPEMGEAVYKKYMTASAQKALKTAISLCDAVVVSCQPLADKVLEYVPEAKNVTVIPNFLPMDLWNQAAFTGRISQDDGQINIGWTASFTHRDNAELVDSAVDAVLTKHAHVKFYVVGHMFPGSFPKCVANHEGRIVFVDWQSMGSLPALMSYFDIGLAPIKDTPFNQCKSGIKALQYWAMKTAVVYSPVEPYHFIQDGVTGLAASSEEEWVKNLLFLVENQDARKQIGESGYVDLIVNHQMSKNVDKWEAVLAK